MAGEHQDNPGAGLTHSGLAGYDLNVFSKNLQILKNFQIALFFPAQLVNVAGEGQKHNFFLFITCTHPPGSMGAAQTPPLPMATMNLLLHAGASPK